LPLLSKFTVHLVDLVFWKASMKKLYESQALTYLRLTSLILALVINFGQRIVKSGIHRVVNGL